MWGRLELSGLSENYLSVCEEGWMVAVSLALGAAPAAPPPLLRFHSPS